MWLIIVLLNIVKNFKTNEEALSKVLPHLRNHRRADVSNWNNSNFYRSLQHQDSSKAKFKLNGHWSYCSFNWSLQPQIKITLSKHSQHPKTLRLYPRDRNIPLGFSRNSQPKLPPNLHPAMGNLHPEFISGSTCNRKVA